MDVDAMAKGLSMFSAALATLRQVLDMLPNNSKKAEIAATLERAEREFKQAEGYMAMKLEYQVCRNHWPPEVMLSADNTDWVCPKCGNKKNTSML